MKKHRLLFLAIALISSQIYSQQITCNRFEPSVTIKASQITVFLDTDLPDFTELVISISRSYLAGAPQQRYPINYMYSKSTVGEWRKPHIINIDNNLWRKKLDDRILLMAKAGEPIKIASIDEYIIISFTVPINQSNSRFGKSNTNLHGKKVTTKFGLNVVDADIKVEYPLEKVKQSTPEEFCDPQDLKQGMKYQISRETPMMPERHPTDPLKAISLIKKIPSGSFITIISVDKSDTNNPWYRVKSSNVNGIDLGTGWINSIALIGQDIKTIK